MKMSQVEMIVEIANAGQFRRRRRIYMFHSPACPKRCSGLSRR